MKKEKDTAGACVCYEFTDRDSEGEHREKELKATVSTGLRVGKVVGDVEKLFSQISHCNQTQTDHKLPPNV